MIWKPVAPISISKGTLTALKSVALLVLMTSSSAFPDVSGNINKAASEAFQDSNLVVRNDKVILFGTQTNGADTHFGKYACAKVVSVTLRKAGVDIPVTLGVSGIETTLKPWKRVSNADSLRPGDVVVWISRFKGNQNGSCTGGGTCHVGIFSEKGFFHNNPLGYSPIYNGIGLKLGNKFKAGYRPPSGNKTGG